MLKTLITVHLCAELIAASMLEPLGEVGANFSLQLSSRTQFTKINNKKVIAENQCEKHKKSSLVCSMIALQGLPFDLPYLPWMNLKVKIKLFLYSCLQ